LKRRQKPFRLDLEIIDMYRDSETHHSR
jgi:hypothetical protein